MRVTFVTPHQRPTSGGVYAIHQYSALLAEQCEVTLAVLKGEPRPVPGCAVVTLESAPKGDIVVYPADLHLEEMPDGVPVCYLQGFGTPGNPTVEENLDRKHAVIASARWLAAEAEQRGCSAYHVPYGIDRETFFPGPPAAQRDKSVLMMTHTLAWKGTEDGLAALALVREDHPDVTIRMFGPHAPDLPGAQFSRSPERVEVADLMRRSAVFVCPSWEEGFGMPGLEAMACGAALVTNDTKGSRDYAVHRESALVVPPRQPTDLADAVCELLERPELRASLVSGGLRQADLFPSWSGSAERFEACLKRILDGVSA